MATYCAFLRGINVNGIRINMQDLADAFRKMGLLDAVTVLGTGNVVFTAKSDINALKLLIARGLPTHFSYTSPIFLRRSDQLPEVIKRANLHRIPDDYHHYFLICDDLNIIVDLTNHFKTLTHAAQERLVPLESGLLWQIPKGQTLSSDFGKSALGRKYIAHLTSRNMNTIKKVYHAMQALEGTHPGLS